MNFETIYEYTTIPDLDLERTKKMSKKTKSKTSFRILKTVLNQREEGMDLMPPLFVASSH